MKQFAALSLFVLLASPALAQVQHPPVIDGSDAGLTPTEVTAITWAVAKDFRDPLSSQYMNLRRGKQEANYKAWCGSVNTKNVYGAYTGFSPFTFVIRDGQPSTIFPMEGPAQMRQQYIQLMRNIQAAVGC